MTLDIRNSWVFTIATQTKNPNLTGFYFGQIGKTEGQDRYIIEADRLHEAWRMLGEQLVKENHPRAFVICDHCEGRGWVNDIGVMDCSHCNKLGWKHP